MFLAPVHFTTRRTSFVLALCWWRSSTSAGFSRFERVDLLRVLDRLVVLCRSPQLCMMNCDFLDSMRWDDLTIRSLRHVNTALRLHSNLGFFVNPSSRCYAMDFRNSWFTSILQTSILHPPHCDFSLHSVSLSSASILPWVLHISVFQMLRHGLPKSLIPQHPSNINTSPPSLLDIAVPQSFSQVLMCHRFIGFFLLAYSWCFCWFTLDWVLNSEFQRGSWGLLKCCREYPCRLRIFHLFW